MQTCGEQNAHTEQRQMERLEPGTHQPNLLYHQISKVVTIDLAIMECPKQKHKMSKE